MVRSYIKFKILLDESLPPRKKLPTTNHDFYLKHIKHDFKLESAADEVIYKIAEGRGYLIATTNQRHFKKYLKRSKTGIIGIKATLRYSDVDKKLCALLKKNREKDLFGKITLITGETGKNK